MPRKNKALAEHIRRISAALDGAPGSVVMGFAGYGGWDYMRHGRRGPCVAIFMRRVSFAANGFFVPGEDVAEAAEPLREAAFVVREGGERYAALRPAALRPPHILS